MRNKIFISHDHSLRSNEITMTKHRVIILYDSIFNSVFESQVLKPLIQNHKQENVHLISFEKNSIPHETLATLRNQGIVVHIYRRIPFLGLWSLRYARYCVQKILSKLPLYEVIARGPHASFIALHVSHTQCSSITIQARGLLAEEFAYARHNNAQSLFKKLLFKLRLHHFTTLEHIVYRFPFKSYEIPTIIEAVSLALKKYLIQRHHLDPRYITIAQHDIPQNIPHAQCAVWRTTIRKKLHIPDDAYVYCYNGSLKTWQCPEKIFAFFNESLQKNASFFLLVLTQDINILQDYLKQNSLQSSHIKIYSIPHENIYQYLAAADSGIVFRKPHIINWVSRPTKVLEYQTVHLSLVHNATISLLVTT